VADLLERLLQVKGLRETRARVESRPTVVNRTIEKHEKVVGIARIERTRFAGVLLAAADSTVGRPV
jgi:hypothetical protein